MSGCQTIRKETDEEKKLADILNSQKTLIISFLNKGMPQLAHKELRTLMKKYPKDADFKNLMGLTQLALENPKKAVQFFHESLQIQQRPAVVLNLSSAYIEARQPLQAAKLLTALLKSDQVKAYPYPERIRHNLAFAYEKHGNVKAAIHYYRQALSENPHYYLSLMRLGQLHERQGQTQKAIAQFKTARSACNRCFDPVGGLAMNQLGQGKTRAAITTIKSYLRQKELRPEDQKRAQKLLQTARNIQKTMADRAQKGMIAKDQDRSKRPL